MHERETDTERMKERLGLEWVHNGPWLYLPKDSEIIDATNPISKHYLVKILHTKDNDIRERGRGEVMFPPNST